MSTKATYNPDDKAVKQGISIPASLLALAKEQSKLEHGSNLSRYLADLIQRDNDGGASVLDFRHPLLGLVKEVIPDQVEAVTAAFLWVPSETLAKIQSEVDTAQFSVVEKLNLRMAAKNEEEFQGANDGLASALNTRVWAQRKLRRAHLLLNEKELLIDMSKALVGYAHAARELAEKDDEQRKSSSPRDPQFALRNPLALETPEERTAKERQRPVIIPKGVYDDLQKRLAELEAKLGGSPD